MWMTIFFLVFVPALVALAGLAYFFALPDGLPSNIPTIPFYYALLPLVKENDQVDLYHTFLQQPLTEFGAVKLFFGGRWNILIRKPAYIAEVLKNEDIYAKSGNQKKIPYGVLAEYTGDNIISSHGENWKLYSSIFKPALQQDYDPKQIWINAGLLIQLIGEEQTSSGRVNINLLLQRYTLANLSELLLGSSFETLHRPDAPLHVFQTRIKPKIFDPIFLNFPFLDHLKSATRQEARTLVQQFTDSLCETVERGHVHCSCRKGGVAQNLGCRLLATFADGILTERQLRHNLISAFLAGHENPQLLIISVLFLLAEHKGTQEKLRLDIASLGPGDPDYSALQSLPLLTATIYEALRLYPPISQLINRCTTQPVMLGGRIPIPAGTYVGYNAYSTNRDVDFWGEDSKEFRPERWGSTIEEITSLFRMANAKGAFISFHGGRRACLGQKFAMLETRITVAKLLQMTEWEIDPQWQRQMTPVGFSHAMVQAAIDATPGWSTLPAESAALFSNEAKCKQPKQELIHQEGSRAVHWPAIGLFGV